MWRRGGWNQFRSCLTGTLYHMYNSYDLHLQMNVIAHNIQKKVKYKRKEMKNKDKLVDILLISSWADYVALQHVYRNIFVCSCRAEGRVVCPNIRHPALTSSLTKYKILQEKDSPATVVNGLSVLKLFQLSNGDLLFCSMPTASSKCLNLE